MRPIAPILLSAIIGLSCQSPTQLEPIGQRIEFSTVILSSHQLFDRNYDRAVPELFRFDALSDIQTYLSQKSIQPGLMDSIAKENFEASSLLLILLKWQGTGMIDVTIDSVFNNGLSYSVYATRLLPPPDRPVTDDIGFPCHIIRVPKLPGSPKLISLGDGIRS